MIADPRPFFRENDQGHDSVGLIKINCFNLFSSLSYKFHYVYNIGRSANSTHGVAHYTRRK